MDGLTAQLNEGRNVYEIKVNTKLSVIKPIHARRDLCNPYMIHMILKGFEMASIMDALSAEEFDEEDLFMIYENM